MKLLHMKINFRVDKMKTAIIYVSSHHGNTKRIIDAMAEVKDIDFYKISQAKNADFSTYDAIGFASGVYFHKLHKGIEKLSSDIDLTGKKVFTIYTCGINYINYARSIQKTIKSQNCEFIGGFSCRGYDTYGFFEKIGGIAKGHPNEKDLAKAQEFIKKI